MSSEAAFQKQILKRLRQVGDAHKHTDAQAGVPDISATLFGRNNTRPLDVWIELKEGAGEWLSKEQALWMRKRGEVGGNCYMMRLEGRWVHLWWWEEAIARGAPYITWQGCYPDAGQLARYLRRRG